MQKRKQIVIDRQFQFKTTFTIIGIVTLLAVVIISAIAASAVYNNRKIEQINAMEDNIVQYLQIKTLSAKDADIDKKAMKEIAINHSNNMNEMTVMIKRNKVLLLVLIGIMVLQGVILYLLLIRKTHRIAGPVYVMSNYMKEIIGGKIPTVRKIRKDDEMQEFYSIFTDMVESIRKRGK